MHPQLRLHMVKQFINLFTWTLNKILPETKPSYPQTRILRKVFQNLDGVCKLEVYVDRFGDRNFPRLLHVLQKGLLFVAEHDRYYRQWLALAMLESKRQIENYVDSLTLEQFKREVKRQWLLDFSAIPESHFKLHKNELAELLLTDYLCNLSAHVFMVLYSKKRKKE